MKASVSLVQLPAVVLDALAAGDLDGANRVSPVRLTDDCIAPPNRRVWQRRSRQVAADPASAAWITRVIVDPALPAVVGRAGYHGPPDDAGMVEVGYAVDPLFRRRGYARAALECLLRRAALEPAVHVVRVTISPDNTASIALVALYSFVEVGTQWDDEDGWETIYERPASP